MHSISCVILAAGQGKRMQGNRPKVLTPLLGKPMLNWVMDSAKGAGASRLCVVAGHMHEAVMEHVGKSSEVALQLEQLGTGHAVMMAEDFISRDKEAMVLVLTGDTPLITSETIKSLCEAHVREGNAATVLCGYMDNPHGYGRIIRGEDGCVTAIVEHRDAGDEELLIKEVNSGIYCFSAGALLWALSGLERGNVQGEYYLTDTISLLTKRGDRVGGIVAPDSSELMGVNDRLQLYEATQAAKWRIARQLMERGVTVCDISSCEIGPDCHIAPDAVIMPATVLRGKCTVGEGSIIGPATQLRDVTVGQNTTVNASVAMNCTIGDHCEIGPFAYIRPDSVVGNGVKVGDFVEVKNSNIGDGTKISHLTYVGDSDVGKDVNFGCGTVTVNYDGQKKHRTTVCDGAFLGCNTNLVAPVTVGKNSYTAAGSTITQDVPEGALGIARERQRNIEGWVNKREVSKK